MYSSACYQAYHPECGRSHLIVYKKNVLQIFVFCSFLCVWCVNAYACSRVHEHTWMIGTHTGACVWSPEVDINIFLHCSPPYILKLSPLLKPELTYLASIADLFALGNPISASCAQWDYRYTALPSGPLCGSWESKLPTSWLYRKPFTLWVLSPAPQVPFLCDK